MSESDQETMPARRIAAVIVHYGDQNRTVRAVLNHSRLGVFSNIVIVANDLSQRPESLKDISCAWLIPRRNIGFGDACQLAATTCLADVYAFFNAHVTIDRISVDRCASAFDTADVGIASPYLYHPGAKNPTASWNYTYCTRTYSPILRLPIQVPLKSGRVSDEREPVELIDNDWATGGAIFCRDDVIRDVGWDGSYFLGFEDVDISMRAKKRGWRVVIVASAIAFHSGESTRKTTASAYYGMRNALWFARKYYGRRIQIFLTAFLLLRLSRLAAADVLKRRRPPHSMIATRGMLDGWLLRRESSESLATEPLWSK